MIQRSAEKHLKSLFSYFPVLFVTGPRQSGKTTLVQKLFNDLPYVLLEFPDQRKLAMEDPRAFIAQYENGAIFDEVQQVPELFSYLQGRVDENKEARFVLTGSQNFLLNERISQSLAGRAGVSVLLPLSYKEIASDRKADTLEELIYNGFYPGLYNGNIPPELFYPSYTQTYLERDVRSLTNVGDLYQFNVFLKLCAGRVGQLLNITSLATDAGISVNTAKAWLSILETSYIIYRLQPYYKNFSKRLIKSPKLYFIDTGLACNLLGIKSKEQVIQHFAYGALFENFIIMDILKERLSKGLRDGLFFWRDSKGVEIDLLIEEGDSLKAVEIKGGKTLSTDYFKNLAYWAKLSDLSADNSVVIYGGEIEQKTKLGKLINWKSVNTLI
jgi:predicted AAA+ superfamily ATPase